MPVDEPEPFPIAEKSIELLPKLTVEVVAPVVAASVAVSVFVVVAVPVKSGTPNNIASDEMLNSSLANKTTR